MKFFSYRRRGFTLIEILISVGLIAIISMVVSQVFLSTVRTSTKAELLKDVKQNGDFALDVIARMIRSAGTVSSACTVAGNKSPSLSIVNVDDSGGTTFECVQDGTVMRIASRSASKTEFLTSANVSIGGITCADSTLFFTCTLISNEVASIKVEFSLFQAGSLPDQFQKASTSYQTTVLSRN